RARRRSRGGLGRTVGAGAGSRRRPPGVGGHGTHGAGVGGGGQAAGDPRGGCRSDRRAPAGFRRGGAGRVEPEPGERARRGAGDRRDHAGGLGGGVAGRGVRAARGQDGRHRDRRRRQGTGALGPVEAARPPGRAATAGRRRRRGGRPLPSAAVPHAPGIEARAVISFLEGEVADKSGTRVVISVAGIGYEVLVPTSTAATLPPVGGSARLFTRMQVRDDAIVLYGFGSPAEREL